MMRPLMFVAVVLAAGCGTSTGINNNGYDMAGLPMDAAMQTVADLTVLPDMTGENPNCGHAGQACCADGTCAGGFACRGANCVSCGRLGETCCAGNACTAMSSVCTGGVCASCGGPGQPCCADNACSGGGCCAGNMCVAAGSSCGNMLGNCNAGKCDNCGSAGQPCCRGSCTQASTVCNFMNTCVACGGPGQACCANAGCTTGCCNANVCVAVGAMCGQNNMGTCKMGGMCDVPCGNDGQACCNGTMCKNNGCCIPMFTMMGLTTNCVASGNMCGGGMGTGVCMNGGCGGGTCGSAGQPCCGMGFGAFCTAPNVTCGGFGMMNRTCEHCGALGELCCNGQCAQGNCGFNFMCQ